MQNVQWGNGKMSKDTVTVYWSFFSGVDRQDHASFFSNKPEPLLKTLPEKDSSLVNNNFGYRACRGMLNLHKNTFVSRSPVTSTVKFSLEDTIEENGGDYWLSKERPFKDSLRVDLDFGYIYFSEEELTMRQVPPYMHRVKSSETSWMSAGSYDISKWFRPIFPSYVLWDKEKHVSIVEGEPDMYLQFETNKKIIFKRFEFTNEMYVLVNELMNLRDRNSIASLNFLYDVFIRSYRNKKVLKMIKENLLD